jgi:hypothetical protein|tara:strand:+ start:366 stop:488 length:123 start_codon:yes stop_codon:yes gene_type:complete
VFKELISEDKEFKQEISALHKEEICQIKEMADKHFEEEKN